MALQNRLVPLHDALFSETSPGPVKFAASLLGKTSERCRLPLAPIMEADAGAGEGGHDRGRTAELNGAAGLVSVTRGSSGRSWLVRGSLADKLTGEPATC